MKERNPNRTEKIVSFGVDLLIICATVLSFIMCSSCGVRKGTIDTYTHDVDSSFNTIKKEQAAVSKDSAQEKRKESNSVKETSDSGGIKAEFYNSDSTKPSGPVIIKVDSNGTLTIDPGGRSLKSISNSKKRTEKKQEQTKASDSTHVVNSSNVNKIDSSSGQLTETVKSKNVKRSSFQIPWYAYVIFIAIGILVWLFWGQLMAAKKIAGQVKFPYSSPNDKS